MATGSRAARAAVYGMAVLVIATSLLIASALDPWVGTAVVAATVFLVGLGAGAIDARSTADDRS